MAAGQLSTLGIAPAGIINYQWGGAHETSPFHLRQSVLHYQAKIKTAFFFKTINYYLANLS